MARAFFCAYYSYNDFMEELTDEEAGRLMRAVFLYAKDGEKSELPPLERMAYRVICAQIDRDNNRYEEICERNRENVRKRYEGGDELRSYADASKDKEKDKDNEKDKDKEREREREKEKNISIANETEKKKERAVENDGSDGFWGPKVDNSVENSYDAVENRSHAGDPVWREMQIQKLRRHIEQEERNRERENALRNAFDIGAEA